MQTKPAGQRICLYNSKELAAIVHAMAIQAAALLPPGQSALVGILRRASHWRACCNSIWRSSPGKPNCRFMR
jgi:hypothetical protein